MMTTRTWVPTVSQMGEKSPASGREKEGCSGHSRVARQEDSNESR